jgi:hypothetical protein
MPRPGGAGPRGGATTGGDTTGRGEAAPEDVTPVNKIPRPRYLHVTPQRHHLPLALRVIVEQGHGNDVLAAVANSRLRIQITQVQLSYPRGVQSTQLMELTVYGIATLYERFPPRNKAEAQPGTTPPVTPR